MISHGSVGRLRSRAGNAFYGWRLVPVAGLIMTVSTTPMFHAMGLWFVAMEHSFGWSRTQLSMAFAFTRVEGGILGPIEGYLVDRLGTRRLVFIGLLIMGAGWLCFGQIRSLWMFYLAYVIVALGQGLGGWLALTTMLNNWFSRRRATAMGWASSSSRMGSLLLIPALAWAMDPEFDRLRRLASNLLDIELSRASWSLTATLLGIVVIALAFPLSRFIRNRPEEYGLLPDGDPPATAPRRAGPGAARSALASPDRIDFTLQEALRTRAFWLISIGHGFTSMVLIGLVAHLPPMMTDQGYSLQTAAFVITAYTAVSMVFQVVGGVLGDRVPKHIALTVFVLIQSGAVFLLTYGPATLPIAYLFAMLFGMGFGGRSPLTTAIRGDYFGRKSFGKIMGLAQVPMNVLLLIAPIFAGVMRDRLGDYTVAFTVLACCSAFGALLFFFAKRPAPPTALRS